MFPSCSTVKPVPILHPDVQFVMYFVFHLENVLISFPLKVNLVMVKKSNSLKVILRVFEKHCSAVGEGNLVLKKMSCDLLVTLGRCAISFLPNEAFLNGLSVSIYPDIVQFACFCLLQIIYQQQR